jgi:hypothetical protein
MKNIVLQNDGVLLFIYALHTVFYNSSAWKKNKRKKNNNRLVYIIDAGRFYIGRGKEIRGHKEKKTKKNKIKYISPPQTPWRLENSMFI